jgi:hypothetical protein
MPADYPALDTVGGTAACPSEALRRGIPRFGICKDLIASSSRGLSTADRDTRPLPRGRKATHLLIDHDPFLPIVVQLITKGANANT